MWSIYPTSLHWRRLTLFTQKQSNLYSYLSMGRTFATSPSPCWYFVWVELVHVLCMWSQSLWVHLCIWPIFFLFRKTLHSWTHKLPLVYTTFLPFRPWIPLSIKGVRLWYRYPIYNWTLQIFLHCMFWVVDLCANCYLLQEETPLLKVDCCTDKWVKQCASWICLFPCILTTIIVVVFH